MKAQIARPSSPYSRGNIVHYNFLKQYYIRRKLAYASSLTYILAGMLITLPYYSFKSYFTYTKLYRTIIYQQAVCLKTFLNEGNSLFSFKQYTTMVLQLYMLL